MSGSKGFVLLGFRSRCLGLSDFLGLFFFSK
jgi:hypothetical protein